ncbi:MAG TPA: glycosyltransferase family 4 protein [Acidobacteriaceae bacterium]|jgi:glycosyltransferase involved in cell wall biosynthesis|nr:glycosyltransferase family 4 protein [Acidobacteriaceae bacterium]
MRLLLTTDTVGGVWTFTRELTQELLSRGHQIALVSFGRAPSDEQLSWCAGQEATYDEAFVFAASHVPLEWMQENERAFREGSEVLLRIAETFRPDLLHSNQFCYGALPLEIPKLVTAHSDVLGWAEACRPGGLEPSAWLRRYRALVQIGLARANAVAAPTEWMGRALRAHYPGLTELEVIYNGRSPMERTVDVRSRMQAVTVGRLWDEGKNIAMLRDVTAPMPIIVAGEQRHESSRSTTELGAALLIGRQTEQELAELFSGSRIYIATSVYEPFGLAPLEAALFGCAVLANDIPSLREVWGEGALYFRDTESLSALLQRLSTDGEALARARERSQARAREFTPQRMADCYEALYASLILQNVEAHGNSPIDPFEEFAAHAA